MQYPHNPADLLASYPTSNNLATICGTEGVTSGFGYVDVTSDPGIFTTWATLKAYFIANGFFTGYIIKRYYTPEQAAELDILSFDLPAGYAPASVDGIEYRMRVEGITNGDFTTSYTAYAPGMASCDIIQTLSDEGFVTGAPETAMAADHALTDWQCTDGRCYGSGCVAPEVLPINLVVANTTGSNDYSTFVEYTFPAHPYPTRLFLFLQEHTFVVYTGGVWIDINDDAYANPERCGRRIEVYQDDGAGYVRLPSPKLGHYNPSAPGTKAYIDYQETKSPIGVITLAANATPTFKLLCFRAGTTWAFGYTAHLDILVFKQECAP